MRDDDRTQRPERARTPQGTARPRPAASKPVARPSNLKERDVAPAKRGPLEEGARPAPQRQRTQRRDADYLYPDEEYYRKAARPSGSKSSGVKKKKKKKQRTSGASVVLYSLFAVVAAVLLAFALKTTIVDVVQVSGDAMAYTLKEGDWVLVTKFDYWSGSPEQYDVVAVQPEKMDGTIIRRVIAGPEQTVEITGMGDTLVNGNTIAEPYVSLMWYQAYDQVTLPRGRYFVLSDNRTCTLDSRDAQVGVVKKNQLSRARCVIWPPSNWKSLDD